MTGCQTAARQVALEHGMGDTSKYDANQVMLWSTGVPRTWHQHDDHALSSGHMLL